MSVEISTSQGVATITFNRPEKLNALTDAMWDQLARHLDHCQSDGSVRVVILTGAGRGFCAGADVSGEGRVWQRKTGLAGTLEIMDRYNRVVKKLYHLQKPTIAAVHGAAVGIAWTMALCCDWVLTTENASFRPAFLNLAKVPEAGFQFLASRLIGQLRARDIIYRSRFLSGREAAELGLATRVVADDSLLCREAEALASELAGAAPLTFALTKRLFNDDSGDFDQFLQMESHAIAIAANSQDAVEGMAAFREKRVPKYRGV